MEDNVMKKYIILISAVLSLAACSQKELEITEEKDSVRFTAILESAQTKTYLGAEDNGQFPVYWSEGDKIKVFVSQHEVSDGQGYQLNLVSGAGTVQSVFSGSVPVLPDGSLYYYAVYPYSLGASIGGGDYWSTGQSPAEHTYDPDGNGSNVWECANWLQIPLPSVQTYSPHSFGRDYNPAIAVSRDQTLRFKNACGVLRLNLTGNVTVGKITIQGDGEEWLWGTLLARYKWRQHSSESELLSYCANTNSSGNSILDQHTLTLDCGSGVQLTNEATDFYLVLPVGAKHTGLNDDYYDFEHSPLYDGFTLRVYDTSGNEVYAKHTDRDNSVHRSMIRNMPVVDVRSHVLTDLSANGTANSYMVQPDGNTYRFYAGNQGTSSLPLIGYGDYSAVILWESRMTDSQSSDPSLITKLNDIIVNVSYNPTTKYVSFRTTDNPGNALIALKDGSDNILWSWHVWSTSYNPNADGSTDTYGSAVLMNRNLGALEKEGNDSFYGLKYQWGRKDPFDVTDVSHPTSNRYSFYPSAPFSSEADGNKSVDFLTAHPTHLVPSGGDLYNLNTKDIALLWGKEKTMYDPCPPGWQVADFDAYYQYVNKINNPSFDITDQGTYVSFNSSTPAAVYPKEPVWTNYHHAAYWGAFSYQLDNFGIGGYSSDLKHVRCQRVGTVSNPRQVVDLSASGTANCYIAQPRHNYKFNATVKGNSNISVGLPYAARLLYSTENTDSMHGTQYGGLRAEDNLIYDIYLKDGYIYFSTSLDNVYGNAIIYLKDPGGRIIWSWHIWIVDYNPNTNYDTIDWGEAGEKKFMKMNLGALNNEMNVSKSMGMMYQWGRKDPFMGAIAYDSNSQAIYQTYDAYNAEYGFLNASEQNSTLLNSLRNPAKAIMDEDEGDGDWLIEHENALWGNTKTMYDPCPPGWKVPSRPIYDSKSVTSIYNYGLSMDGIWYPATGYHHRVSFNLNNVGQEGHYWYATPKDDGNAYSFYFNSTTGNETVDLANHYTPKAQLNAIRCVKDE